MQTENYAPRFGAVSRDNERFFVPHSTVIAAPPSPLFSPSQPQKISSGAQTESRPMFQSLRGLQNFFKQSLSRQFTTSTPKSYNSNVPTESPMTPRSVVGVSSTQNPNVYGTPGMVHSQLVSGPAYISQNTLLPSQFGQNVAGPYAFVPQQSVAVASPASQIPYQAQVSIPVLSPAPPNAYFQPVSTPVSFYPRLKDASSQTPVSSFSPHAEMVSSQLGASESSVLSFHPFDISPSFTVESQNLDPIDTAMPHDFEISHQNVPLPFNSNISNSPNIPSPVFMYSDNTSTLLSENQLRRRSRSVSTGSDKYTPPTSLVDPELSQYQRGEDIYVSPTSSNKLNNFFNVSSPGYSVTPSNILKNLSAYTKPEKSPSAYCLIYMIK